MAFVRAGNAVMLLPLTHTLLEMRGSVPSRGPRTSRPSGSSSLQNAGERQPGMRPETGFVNTNLFLRYLTNDVPEQADAVERLLRWAMAGEVRLLTNELVIAEIVWTLESFYKQSRQEITDKVLAILNTPGLEVANGAVVLQAMVWYAEKKVDFIDAYNGAWILAQGSHAVYTFDRTHFSRLEGLTTLTPDV